MIADTLAAVLQLVVIGAGAPLLVGLTRMLKARLVGRRGAPPWQPYRDLAKLLGKEPVVSATTSWIFRFTPCLLVAAMLVAALVVPVIVTHPAFGFAGNAIVLMALFVLGTFFLALAGLDAGSAFGGMGSSREVAVAALVREFLEVATLSLENTTVLERLQGTGRLTARTAREMQVVGLAARASGLDADARRDAPAGAYHDLDVRIATRETGDVWARTTVRIDEIVEAARLIEVAATRVNGGGATSATCGPLRVGAHATSVVEAWRGPIWYWVLADGASSVARVKVADPSFRNWPALEYAVLENIVPDFPLCNKSFNLSYSGGDL